ncbi:MAG: hypothetical protein H7Y43_05965 [Akkermansiaceae bacterium]|nr:hypothetical protein [Verrucomicrobiales bacterium]
MRAAERKKKKILLPIVVFAREFDGKLLLALLAREHGHRAFLGLKSALVGKMQQLSPMLYIAKSAYFDSMEFFAQLNHAGNKVAVLDEESLVRQSDEIYLMKHHRDSLENVELLLHWGQSDQNLWRSSGLLQDTETIPVGNPRVDMLRPRLRSYFDKEVSSIAGRFGDYVLMNTNFPVVNNYRTHGENLSLAESTERVISEKQKFLSYKRSLFDRFQEIVPALAKEIFPRNLVIRPHPSEMHGPWLEAAKGQTNVHVVLEGSVVPWLIGAGVLIHNGCTSAIEYALLDKMPLSYRSEKSEQYEDSLANKLSLSCFTESALLRQLKSQQLSPSPDQRQLLKQHIEFEDGRLCGEVMLDFLERGHLPELPENNRASIFDVGGMWDTGSLYVDKLRRILLPEKKRKREYSRHKFPDIGTSYVDERIRRFQNCLGRFHGLKSRQIAHKAFEIV